MERRGEAPASDAIITIIDINIAHAFRYYQLPTLRFDINFF
jgi:hypothetical protein